MTAPCRLYLITPLLSVADVEAFAPRFEAVLAGGEVASVLLRLAPAAEADGKRVITRLLEISAKADVALIVDRDARLAARAGADGVHVAGVEAALEEALSSLKPERIVGVGALRLRDDAMTAGEAGADYILFGEPRPDGWLPPFAETLERVEWWAEIFQTPIVGYASSIEEAQDLAAAGADFVALDTLVWSATEPAAQAAEIARLVASQARARG